jgi:hypothetical protein
MADSVVSSGDSDDGVAILGTTPASSKKVAALAVDIDSDDDGLFIVGTTSAPASSETVAADSDEDDEELSAAAATGLARPTGALAHLSRPAKRFLS